MLLFSELYLLFDFSKNWEMSEHGTLLTQPATSAVPAAAEAITNSIHWWVRRAKEGNNEVHGREEPAAETFHILAHILKWLVENYEGAEVP